MLVTGVSVLHKVEKGNYAVGVQTSRFSPASRPASMAFACAGRSSSILSAPSVSTTTARTLVLMSLRCMARAQRLDYIKMS